jgi:hypothetical protein
VYDNYEISDEEFQTDVFLLVVLKDIELDHNEQEPMENFQCVEVVVLPPFSSLESQVDKSKNIQEQLSQSITKKKHQFLLRNLSSLISFMIQLHFGWSLHYLGSHMTGVI